MSVSEASPWSCEQKGLEMDMEAVSAAFAGVLIPKGYNSSFCYAWKMQSLIPKQAAFPLGIQNEVFQ